MNITGPYSIWIGLAIVVVMSVVLVLAWEGLVLSTGVVLVRVLSLGHIRVGERRSLAKAPPKLNGGQVFYYEKGACHVYQNHAQIIGFVFWAFVLLGFAGWTVR